MHERDKHKKRSERDWLEHFRELRPDLKIQEVQDHERPDFLCLVEDVLTGIEVTQFFYPSDQQPPPQAFDTFRTQLQLALRDESSRRALPPVHVSVRMARCSELGKASARQRLAKALTAFVEANIPRIGPHLEFASDELTDEITSMGIDSVALISADEMTHPTWGISSSAWLPSSRAALIQEIIARKSANVSDYQSAALRLWLLIMAGTHGLYSMLHFENDVLTHQYTSAFDRVFICSQIGLAVHELSV